jgi:hypothetical protein
VPHPASAVGLLDAFLLPARDSASWAVVGMIREGELMAELPQALLGLLAGGQWRE